MIEINPTRYKLKPYKHQLEGVKLLLTHPLYALFWKPRVGKTKAIIDTACELFQAGVIDTCLIVAPAQVRDIWTEKELGEIKTHDWSNARTYIYREFGSLFLPANQPCYLAASVEFLRQAGPRGNYPFVDDLLAACSGRRVWFVYDEASTLGDWKSNNTKSMIALRGSNVLKATYRDMQTVDVLQEQGDLVRIANNKGEKLSVPAESLSNYKLGKTDNPIKRVTVLDGTPRGNSHLSFYSKFKVLDPSILGCKTFFHYRAKYSETTKVAHKWVTDPSTGERKVVASHVEVVKEKNQEDFARRTAPYCQFLEQDVLDMPKKVPGILSVAMSNKAWDVYTQMRDDMVAQLDTGIAAVGHAAIKCIRLAQICAGFLGGVKEFTQGTLDGGFDGAFDLIPTTIEIAYEPTEMLLAWLKLRQAEDPDFKWVVWSRFRPEIERLSERLTKAKLHHGVKSGEVDTYKNELHPRSKYQGPYGLVCQPQTAQYGNNFSRARTSIFLSQDYNRVTRSQAAERVQADGAGETTAELDVIVTGPRGQKTIVHDIISSVRNREDAEKRTADDWKRILLEV